MRKLFEKGNPGRPKGIKNRLLKHRESLDEVMTAERQRALWATLFKKAIGGDVAAARLIVEYLLGRAPQPVTLEGTIEHQHHAIPDDELREIAMRSAKRLVEQNRLELAAKRAKTSGNGVPKSEDCVDLSARAIPALPSAVERTPTIEQPPPEWQLPPARPTDNPSPPELPKSGENA